MNKETAVALKRQRNNNEATAPSLVIELETAKILQQLSRKGAGDNIPDDRVVSPTSSYGGSISEAHKKRKICDVGITPHGFYSPPTSVADHSESSTESVTPNFKLPFPLCPEDDDVSSSSTMTDVQEVLSESSSILGFKNTGLLSLGKVEMKPLMQPPQMRHFNNFSSPGSPPIQATAIHKQISEQPAKKKSPLFETAKISNEFVRHTASPTHFSMQSPKLPKLYDAPICNNFAADPRLTLMNFLINKEKSLLQKEIPLCSPIGTEWQQIPKAVIPDQTSTFTTSTFQNVLFPERIAHSLINDIQTAPSPDSKSSKKRKICRMDTCGSFAAKRTPYCARHAGQRKCEFTQCLKFAQGKTRFCIAHGGGRRCIVAGCTRGARDQKCCAAHGGGRRCRFLQCKKLAVGGGFMCTAHGGGKRCQIGDCTKSAQSSSNFCVRHGGGRKCNYGGCDKVARGKTGMCMSHANQSIPPLKVMAEKYASSP